jgi:hypothetical protein
MRTTRTPGSRAIDASSTASTFAPTAAWAQDAAVQHAGQHEVVHVEVATGDLVGQVGPRQRLADQHVLRLAA